MNQVKITNFKQQNDFKYKYVRIFCFNIIWVLGVNRFKSVPII